MVSFHVRSGISSAVVAGLILSLVSGCEPEVPETTDADLFFLFDEELQDTPVKTQIVQHVVATSPPTKDQLEAEALTRFRAASNRSGFKHHRNPTNIYVYIYGTEEQARAGQGLWVAMLAKSYSDAGQPPVTINEDRLRALSTEQEDRFGLSEAERKRLFVEIGMAEDRATSEAMDRIPDTAIMEQIELERELQEQFKNELAAEYGLTRDALHQVSVEGVRKGWPIQ